VFLNRAAKGFKAFVKELNSGFTTDLERVISAYKTFVEDTRSVGDAEGAMHTLREFARDLCAKFFNAARTQLPVLLDAPDTIEGLEALWQDATRLNEMLPETRASDGAMEVVLGVFRGRLEGALAAVVKTLQRM